ncbi:MAG: lysophospholipid acyltransferase family protein [Dehalococcoidia bacterium]|nr:lysophospholipid acyltransferase family protein [Dehalococcoidia bacterium]
MQYLSWRAVIALAGRLPLRVSYALATLAGMAGYYLWPRGRRAMLNNYRRVLPGATKSERGAVARRSLVNYCRYLVDFARFPALSAERLLAAVGGEESFRALDAALAEGKGAVIVCMHFGNWDLGAGATAARGYSLAVVAETFADPRLDELVAGARRRLGMEVIKMERAGPSLVRALKRNGLLALLIDRPTPGEGVKVEFFGEVVEVPAGPARLALLTGAPVVVAAFPRVDAGRPEVVTLTEFIEPRTGAEGHDVEGLTRTIMAAHERFIRAYPDQWYMFREMWPATGSRVRSRG